MQCRDETQELKRNILKKYNISKTGKLNREEVRTMCETICAEVLDVGITEDDIDQIMKIGEDSLSHDIIAEDIPDAMATMLTIKKHNDFIQQLFHKYDIDKNGHLCLVELRTLLAEMNGGEPPAKEDLDFVVHRCDDNNDEKISLPELKAAVSCWYCQVEPRAIPETKGEARALGYTEEEIKMLEEELEARATGDLDAEDSDTSLTLEMAEKSRSDSEKGEAAPEEGAAGGRASTSASVPMDGEPTETATMNSEKKGPAPEAGAAENQALVSTSVPTDSESHTAPVLS